ncbi:MAG: TIR domain-containing protein [Vicinamibacterales bacterium]
MDKDVARTAGTGRLQRTERRQTAIQCRLVETPAAEARIFISYRRADAAADAGRLADHLQRRLGPGRVFMDVDAIEPGADFVQTLQHSLAHTAATLVVIGRQWTTIPNAEGRPRLHDPADFVRREVEAALQGQAPVIPVLVQGASMPRADELPASLAALVTRQAVTLDHAEFHDDAQRLCDRLAPLVAPADDGVVGIGRPRRRVMAAVAALGLLALAGWYGLQVRARAIQAEEARVRAEQVRALVEEAGQAEQRRQWPEALAALDRARDLDPASADVRAAEAGVAMRWIREAAVRDGQSTFAEAIAPALAVIDRHLPSATGTERADLLAHQGWATFLLWRDGDRRLAPADRYREALALDPGNPYANAMLAHWLLWQGGGVAEAAALFETASGDDRARDVVRRLQWAAYGNDGSPAAYAELLRLSDRMRREEVPLSAEQAQALWAPYYFSLGGSSTAAWPVLRSALSPDDHATTLAWAFGDYVAGQEARVQTLRFYQALLARDAGRVSEAQAALETLAQEMAADAGTLPDAVRAALRRSPQTP